MDASSPYDPEAFRRLGHQVIDQLADHLALVAVRDTRAHMALEPLSALNAYTSPLPLEAPREPEALLLNCVQSMLASSMQVHHPGCMGHQVASPLPAGILADLVTSFVNQGMAVFETGQMGVLVEKQTVRWLCDAIGWDDASDGVFTSGGSLGNLTALLAARNLAGSRKAWPEGVGAEKPMYILIAATAHYSNVRAAAILGLGAANMVPIYLGGDERMSLAALRQAADDLEAKGGQIMAVVGSACTTATGRYDNLRDIGAFCRERHYWFHVDGAHGASVLLSPRYKHLMDGIELADSLTWDAHKLLETPSLCTAVLFRRGVDSYATFAQEAPYLYVSDHREFDLGLRTFECTKPMLAFKLWLTLQTYGAEALGELVAGLYDRAREFARMLEGAADFALYEQPESNIVCFRHLAGVMDEAELDQHQVELRKRAIATGRVYLVQTLLVNGLHLRVTIMNPRTTRQDLQELLDVLRAAAADIKAEAV